MVPILQVRKSLEDFEIGIRPETLGIVEPSAAIRIMYGAFDLESADSRQLIIDSERVTRRTKTIIRKYPPVVGDYSFDADGLRVFFLFCAYRLKQVTSAKHKMRSAYEVYPRFNSISAALTLKKALGDNPLSQRIQLPDEEKKSAGRSNKPMEDILGISPLIQPGIDLVPNQNSNDENYSVRPVERYTPQEPMTKPEADLLLKQVTIDQFKALTEQLEELGFDLQGHYVDFNRWDRTFIAISQLVMKAKLIFEDKLEQYRPDLRGTNYLELALAFVQFRSNFVSNSRLLEKKLSISQLSAVVDAMEKRAGKQFRG